MDTIDPTVEIETAIWTYLSTVGPVGVRMAFNACQSWLQTYGYSERPPAEQENCDCEDDDEPATPEPLPRDTRRREYDALDGWTP